MIKVTLELHMKEEEILTDYLDNFDKLKEVIQEDVQGEWKDEAIVKVISVEKI